MKDALSLSPAALSMPWATQITLAMGVLGYFVAYRGIRSHHNAVETAFLSLAFGLVARLVQYPLADYSPWIFVSASLAATLVASSAWRLIGINSFGRLARAGNLSWADDTPSAWARLHGDSEHAVSQVSVLLADGTWVSCDDTRPFQNFPHGPVTFGNTGDVLLYVTHTRGKDEERKVISNTIWEETARVTYIPASEVKRVMIRLEPPYRPIRRRVAAAFGTLLGRFQLGPSEYRSHLPHHQSDAEPSE